MEKHTKTELELSEENLQEITGGCEKCTSDYRRIGGLITAIGKAESSAIQKGNAVISATTVNSALGARAAQLKKLSSAADMRQTIEDLRQEITNRHL